MPVLEAVKKGKKDRSGENACLGHAGKGGGRRQVKKLWKRVGKACQDKMTVFEAVEKGKKTGQEGMPSFS